MQKRDIQKEILARLLGAQSLRYRDARPDEVENDLYNYHLQFLVQKGLVEKEDARYRLTDAGQKYVFETRPIAVGGREADLFKVCVLDIVCDISGDKILVLNQERKREPFYGKKGILGGPIKKGEFVLDAAKRNLELETGLIGDFRILGSVRSLIKVEEDESIFSDALYYIGLATSFSGELKNTDFGDNFWSDLDTIIADEEHSRSRSKCVVDTLKNLRSFLDQKEPLFYKEEIYFL